MKKGLSEKPITILLNATNQFALIKLIILYLLDIYNLFKKLNKLVNELCRGKLTKA